MVGKSQADSDTGQGASRRVHPRGNRGRAVMASAHHDTPAPKTGNCPALLTGLARSER